MNERTRHLQSHFYCYNKIILTHSSYIMMNNKFFLCGALVAGLCLTACSKEKEPQHEQQKSDVAEQQNTTEKFQPLNQPEVTPATQTPPEAKPAEHSDMVMADDTTPPPPRPHHHKPRHHTEQPAPQGVEVQREETEHTTTEIRREYKKPHAEQPSAQAEDAPVVNVDAPKPIHKVKAEVSEKPKKASGNLTQDDAVNAALAAAKPAL